MAFVPKELRFKVPWGVLAAKAWGPSEGQPVLCLHGWLDNANTFDRLIPLLPKDHYYVALDFSGHGESSHIPKGMRYQHLDYVSDIHRVVTSLGWRRFSIIGHSMGGVVGLKYSSIFPETVQHLTLLDCYGFFPISIDILLGHMKRAVTQYSRFEGANGAKVYTAEEALQRLLNGNQSLNSDTAKVLLQRGTRPVPGGVIFSRDIRITMINSVPITLEQALYVMKSLQCDVHVILANEGPAADSERGVSTDEAQSILTGFKENLKERFQYTVVDGNHFVHLNEPEKIAKIIVNQLYGRPSIHSRL